jgi:hypothetical protein
VLVVVGGIVTVNARAPTPELHEGVDRILAVYDVLRHDRARYVLVTSDAEEAPGLAKQLADWEVAPDRIMVDDRSRNAHEHATASRGRTHGLRKGPARRACDRPILRKSQP